MKTLLFFLSILSTTIIFGETLFLENRSSHPTEKSRLAIQWASSAKEVEEKSQALLHGAKLNTIHLSAITQLGKIKLAIPKTAEYFRILAWSKGKGKPDLLTNWVEIIPKKTYTLEADHLFPTVLMHGFGC